MKIYVKKEKGFYFKDNEASVGVLADKFKILKELGALSKDGRQAVRQQPPGEPYKLQL